MSDERASEGVEPSNDANPAVPVSLHGLPRDVVAFLYAAYDLARSVQKYGDWDAVYYADAERLWHDLGEWLYP